MVARLSRAVLAARKVPRVLGQGKGRPEHKATSKNKDDVLALVQVGYAQERIATYLGITVATLQKYYRPQLDFGAMDLLKLARRGLNTGLENNEQWAVQFTLRTKGKQYGWLERTEITGKDGRPLIDLSKLSEKQLAALAEIMEAAEPIDNP